MRLIDADALLEAIGNTWEYANPMSIIDLITNAPTVQREADKIVDICLSKLSELKAPKNYNAAESHAYEQAHSDCWKIVRKLLDSNAKPVQREGWVSVDDRLPENNTFGFGYGYWQGEIHGTDKQKSIEYGEFIDGEIIISGDYYDARLVKISHWFSFELPAAPSETE